METITEIRNVTYDEIRDALLKYRDSDNVNPGCVYTAKDGRHCLVGQVFEDLHIPCPTDKDDNQFGDSVNKLPIISDRFDDWLRGHGVIIDSDARWILCVAQEYLDRTYDEDVPESWFTWASAVEAAIDLDAYDENFGGA